ncbi:MAG: hypothetical protein EZS28_021033 [Streblomastix strix]|uniref:Uncharacterized protein n=1 Tax=Streblomastix strix TaxID=222440 RepID=A0A5J4VLQ5_9EUKA|nr:MAG: hypothetical protein EZS28_021033 [Streblomastix strix]
MNEPKKEIIEMSQTQIDRFCIKYFKQLKVGWICDIVLKFCPDSMKPGNFRLKIHKNCETIRQHIAKKYIRLHKIKEDKIAELEQESIKKFKKYVRSTIMKMQYRTQMIVTKDLIVVIFSTFQTDTQKVSGRNYPIHVQAVVASTIKAKNYIKPISYDQSEDNFVEKWLDQVFIEAIQVRSDNQFSDEMLQRYEVHIIGFDCLKSATTLQFKNHNSSKYEIVDRYGPRHVQYISL